jgi:hypothetical protein
MVGSQSRFLMISTSDSVTHWPMPSKKEKGEFDPADHSLSAAVSSRIVSDAKGCYSRGVLAARNRTPRRRVSFGGEKVKTVHLISRTFCFWRSLCKMHFGSQSRSRFSCYRSPM